MSRLAQAVRPGGKPGECRTSADAPPVALPVAPKPGVVVCALVNPKKECERRVRPDLGKTDTRMEGAASRTVHASRALRIEVTGAFLKLLAMEPPIKPGTPDPYTPPKPGGAARRDPSTNWPDHPVRNLAGQISRRGSGSGPRHAPRVRLRRPLLVLAWIVRPSRRVGMPPLCRTNRPEARSWRGYAVFTGPAARIPAEAPNHADVPSGTRGIRAKAYRVCRASFRFALRCFFSRRISCALLTATSDAHSSGVTICALRRV
jgi:hypothetical protein